MTDTKDEIDKILWRFATYMKRAMGGRQVGGEEYDHDHAKAAIEKLILEARIDELELLFAFAGESLGASNIPEVVIAKRIKELKAKLGEK